MNNHILIRNALLGSWNVGSEYIRLCGNEKFETPDELSSRFNINVLLQTLFREPSEFSAELLMESYLNAQNGDEGNQLFLRAFKIDDEYAVSIDPRRIVDTLMWQCANGKSSEGLYEAFEIWSKFVPAQPSKTN